MTKKKPKRKKLTKEEKKAVWAKPTSNAGAGWKSEATDPIVDYEGRKK
jgi:hypothetical protein